MEQFKTHLQFLGYTVSQETDTVLIAQHPTNSNMVLSGFAYGALLCVFYTTTDQARVNRLGFLEFINTLNGNSSLSHFYVNEDSDFCIQALYMGDYDQIRFGQVLDWFNEECDAMFDVEEYQVFLE
jgi:hypothetical protein